MLDDVSTQPAGAPAPGAPVEQRYARGERLGEGGMGVVYAARDTKLDREVALKLLHDRYLGAQHQERLAAEARAMARLSHPNVVAVYDVGEQNGRTFLAMELVRGSSLSAWLEQPRCWQDIVAVFRDVAAGLAAAHAAGIVHRDVKPTNILIGDDGRVRVADFGVASAVAVPAEPDERVTAETAGMIGSPLYMSIEQLCGERSDERTDQFGLCVTLYEALHGKRPFDARTRGGLIVAIARGAPPPVRDVPRWLHAVVARGLAADPDQRFASMTALGAALRGPSSRIVPLALGAGALAVVTAVAIGIAARGSSAPQGDAPVTAAASTTDAASVSPNPNASGGAMGAPNAPSTAANNTANDAANQAASTPSSDASNGASNAASNGASNGASNAASNGASNAASNGSAVARAPANARPPSTAGSASRASPEEPFPDDPREREKLYHALVKEAQAAFAARDYAGALERDERAARLRDDLPEAHSSAAAAACHLNDVKRARAHVAKLGNGKQMFRGCVIHICSTLGVDLSDMLLPNQVPGCF